MANRRRYWMGLLVSAGLLTGINLLFLRRATQCGDCIYPYGFPFPFFMTGGFGGIHKFNGINLVLDLLVLLVVADVVSSVWKRFSRNRAGGLRRG